jgi:predicted ATPase/Tfp pilus assembly protein PilF
MGPTRRRKVGRPGDSPGETHPPSGSFPWGPLHVLEKIGEGSFGEVFRAFEPVLQREVALKLARETVSSPAGTSAAPMDEARRLARVRHPNVLIIHGIEVHDSRTGMWTEYIHGKTLEGVLVDDGVFDPGEIARIGIDLCRALAAVHAAGVVHGDVKASNVMREMGGRTVLMDFGAGADLRDGRPPGEATTHSITGTPLMMAPELFEGALPSVRSDLYALGVLLFRLATGSYPIMARTQEELAARVRDLTPIDLRGRRPEIPGPLAEAIERALRKDPAGRFPTAAEMRAAIETGTPAPPASLDAERPSHLPQEIGRFIGRERELAEIRRLVLAHPLVTLVGAGGSGKTRLALRATLLLHSAIEHGAHWIDLAPLAVPESLPLEIAHAVGVREQGREEIEDQLVEHLRERNGLLALDNCEHLRPAVAALLQRVLRDCPGIRILATSREEIGVSGEVRFDVGPMEIPGVIPSREADPDRDLAACESVQLFVERARGSRTGFALTPLNAPSIARICRRVEGIPLAIELAAARVTALGTEQIASRLEESFRLLSGGRDEAAPHHRTIQACIEWSYRLLSPEEQRLLQRLALFAGRWSLEAAERACADSITEGSGIAVIGSREVGDVLRALEEKSLVQSETRSTDEPDATRPTYRMLEMVRRFSMDRLDPAEEVRTRTLLLGYYYELTLRAKPDMSTPREPPWIDRFAAEHENLRSILDWCIGQDRETDRAIRVVSTLRRFWLLHGHLREGLGYVQGLLQQELLSEDDRTQLLYLAASLTVAYSDYESTLRFGEEALVRMRAGGDRKGTAAVLAILGIVAVERAEWDLARDRIEESIAIDRELGNLGPIPNRLNSLGILASRRGDHSRAESYFRDALTVFRETGDVVGIATMLGNLSTTVRNLGRPDRALQLAEESLAMTRGTSNRTNEGKALRSVAMARIELGAFDAARRDLCEALSIEREFQNPMQLIWCLEAMAQLEQAAGQPSRALRIIAATETMRLRTKTPLPDPDREDRRAHLDRLRTELGEEAFASMRAEGQAMTSDDVVAFAQTPPE